MLQLHLSGQQIYCILRCDLYQRFDGTHSLTCLYLGGTLNVLMETPTVQTVFSLSEVPGAKTVKGSNCIAVFSGGGLDVL